RASEGKNLFGEGTETEPKAPKKQRRAERRSAADTDEPFARFWSAYPKHVAKEAARRAYDKAIKRGADPEVIIAGAQRYAVAERARIGRGEARKYPAHAATWLNGRRWEDPPPDGLVLDQDGNAVAIQQPPPQYSDGGDPVMERYEEARAELAK